MIADSRMRGGRRLTVPIALALFVPALSGATCNRRVAVDDLPAGILQVRYVPAADYSDCLIASVVMCANYVAGSEWVTRAEARQQLATRRLDHTRVGDVQAWLTTRGFVMTPIRGDLSAKPPCGLAWWVQDRGYPVICVVNQHGGVPDYNHAVLVIGVNIGEPRGELGAVYVLDPASSKRLERWDRQTFEGYWDAAGRVMLPLFQTPRKQGHRWSHSPV